MKPPTEKLLPSAVEVESQSIKDRLLATFEAAVTLDSEKANAQRIVEHHAHELRFVKNVGWYYFNKGWWRLDGLAAQRITSSVSHYVKQAAEERHRQASAARDDNRRQTLKDESDRLTRWAGKSERQSVIQGTLTQMQYMLVLDAHELNAHLYLLNVYNGTIDLETGLLRSHDPNDFLTTGANVWFDPDATAPTWEAFLERILPSRELRRYVQKAIGYSLSGSVEEQIIFMLYGKGSNGKSTFLNVLLGLLGSGYAKRAVPDLLISSSFERHPTEIADLEGARLVYVSEVNTNGRFATGRIKELTGETSIKGRRMRQDFFELTLTCKLWLAVNDKPEVRDNSHGFWRRLKIIPFTATISDEEKDSHLLDKLEGERPGILNWALEGFRLWRAEGLADTPEMLASLSDYRHDMDSVGRFIDEACETGDSSLRTPAGELYPHYLTWCQACLCAPVDNAEFKRQVIERGFPQRKNHGKMFYVGIRPSESQLWSEAA